MSSRLPGAAALVTLVACLSAHPAFAADLPVKAPLQPPQAVGWTGAYIGANVGYAWGHSDPTVTYVGDPATNAYPAAPPSLHGSGVIGGVQAGYNWQLGRWVLGGEVDFSWLNVKANGSVRPFWVTDFFDNYLALSSRYDWLSTARLRTGFLLTPEWLVYATGGLAVTRVEDSASHTYPDFQSTTTWREARTLFGAAVGAGFEYALTPAWSVRAEYLHVFFNDVNPQWTTPGTTAGSPVKFAHSLDVARLGVNYRWGASPIMAAGAGVMPLKAAAIATDRWSGLYAGVHAGYGWGRSNPFATADLQRGRFFDMVSTLPAVHPRGALGGAQVGYNWQAGAFVLGGELDISALGLKNDRTISPYFIGAGDAATFSSSYDWLATARLRAGIAPTPDLLVYVTGGLAVTHVTDKVTHSNIPLFFGIGPTRSFSATTTLLGGTIGGGVEYRLARNWSVKAEYLYAKFNKTAPQTDFVGFAPPDIGFNHDLSIARLGLNYRFDPGPLLAP